MFRHQDSGELLAQALAIAIDFDLTKDNFDRTLPKRCDGLAKMYTVRKLDGSQWPLTRNQVAEL